MTPVSTDSYILTEMTQMSQFHHRITALYMDIPGKSVTMWFSDSEDSGVLSMQSVQPAVKMSVTHAIALHLSTTPLMTGIGERVSIITREVRRVLKNPLLTAKEVRDIIVSWAKKGWVKLTGNYALPTPDGAEMIAAIAARAA
jgi:hypothetical protein